MPNARFLTASFLFSGSSLMIIYFNLLNRSPTRSVNYLTKNSGYVIVKIILLLIMFKKCGRNFMQLYTNSKGLSLILFTCL